MGWVLIVTVMIGGQLHTAEKLKFETKQMCMDVAKQIEKLELVKAYEGKVVCEKTS